MSGLYHFCGSDSRKKSG